ERSVHPALRGAIMWPPLAYDGLIHKNIDSTVFDIHEALTTSSRKPRKLLKMMRALICLGVDAKIVRPEWEKTWKLGLGLSSGWFYSSAEMDGNNEELKARARKQMEALYKAFRAATRFALDVTCPIEQREFAKELNTALELYLSLRGFGTVTVTRV